MFSKEGSAHSPFIAWLPTLRASFVCGVRGCFYRHTYRYITQVTRAGYGGMAFVLCFFLLMAGGSFGWAANLQPSILAPQIIKQITALDQGNTHFIHVSSEIEDARKPRINLESFRYSLRLGPVQWVNDMQFLLEPKKTFNHLETRIKFRALDIPSARTAVAFGLLGRFVEKSEERTARIDNKTSSLFLVVSSEVFPFGNWGGILLNAIWDNRVAGLGTKIQIFRNLRLVFEHDTYHAAKNLPTSNHHQNPGVNRVGLEFEGQEAFAGQLVWSEEGNRAWLLLAFSF